MKQRFSTKKSTNKVNEHLRNDRSLPVMYEFQPTILHFLIIFYSSLVLFHKGRFKSVIEVPQCDRSRVGYIEAYRRYTFIASSSCSCFFPRVRMVTLLQRGGHDFFMANLIGWTKWLMDHVTSFSTLRRSQWPKIGKTRNSYNWFDLLPWYRGTYFHTSVLCIRLGRNTQTHHPFQCTFLHFCTG